MITLLPFTSISIGLVDCLSLSVDDRKTIDWPYWCRPKITSSMHQISLSVSEGNIIGIYFGSQWPPNFVFIILSACVALPGISATPGLYPGNLLIHSSSNVLRNLCQYSNRFLQRGTGCSRAQCSGFPHTVK